MQQSLAVYGGAYLQLLLPNSFVISDNYDKPIQQIFDQSAQFPFTEQYMAIEGQAVIYDYSLEDDPYFPFETANGFLSTVTV